MRLRIQIKRTRRGDYKAACSFLPGCVARGRTCAEAERRFTAAALGYMAAVGNFVPDRVDIQLMAG
jgi:predicted RNase H-like HicB family nuclease